jgi:hypothetical protein
LLEDDPTQGKEERSLSPAESVMFCNIYISEGIDVQEGIKTASGSNPGPKFQPQENSNR